MTTKLTQEDWTDRIGPAAWRKVTSACECGPSVDFAEMAATKALNACVEIGLCEVPPLPPIVADCPECGPIRFIRDRCPVTGKHECAECWEDVVLR